MKYISVLISISLLITIFGCTYGKREGTIQKDSSSNIRFIGNVIDAQIQVDNGEKITLSEKGSDRMNAFNPRKLYQVSPGKHNVKVYRSGEIVVDKLIYVGIGEIKEVNIP